VTIYIHLLFTVNGRQIQKTHKKETQNTVGQLFTQIRHISRNVSDWKFKKIISTNKLLFLSLSCSLGSLKLNIN